MRAKRIAIVGDFDRRKHSHWATEAALFHAGARVGLAVEPVWVPTPSVATRDGVRQLAEYDGIWGAPGSPYASMPGILNAITYAREQDVAYLGTCAGFQYALIEFTRNVLGVHDADTAENNPGSDNIVIQLAYCANPGDSRSTPLLAGPGVARAVPGTLLAELCGTENFAEEYFCSFETNADFVARWEAAGMRVSARGAEGEMRAFELQNRFFMAALFQPQLSSSYERPHPLIQGFLRAAGSRRSIEGPGEKLAQAQAG
jgi:CTP synthase (UTP-ammonia lyase)